MYDFQKQAGVDLKIIRIRQLKELHEQNNLESSPHIMVDQNTMEVQWKRANIHHGGELNKITERPHNIDPWHYRFGGQTMDNVEERGGNPKK